MKSSSYYCIVYSKIIARFQTTWVLVKIEFAWKVGVEGEREDCVMSQNSYGLYLLSILCHLCEVLHENNIIVEINAVENIFSENLVHFPFWTGRTIINHRSTLVTRTYHYRYFMVLQNIVLK